MINFFDGLSKSSIARAAKNRDVILNIVGTFKEERNAEKRTARAHAKRLRETMVKDHPGMRVPKANFSRPKVEMLANRRLRQREGGL